VRRGIVVVCFFHFAAFARRGRGGLKPTLRLEPEPDHDLRDVAGADATAGTLRESLSLCIEAAYRAVASDRQADQRATAS